MRFGRRECSHEEVASILQDISDSAGDVSLHRVTRALAGGDELLDLAGRRAMLPSEDVVPEDGCGGVVAEESGAVLEGRWPQSDVLRLVSCNVAGLMDELGEPGPRMESVIVKLLVEESSLLFAVRYT